MGDKESIRISQVSAGALAAVTAALLGSTMGVAGTVVGAALASVVSTVGGALYLRSIQRTTRSVRTVKAKVVGRSGGATVLVATDDPAEDEPDEPGDEVEAAAEPEDRPPAERRRLRWPMLVVGSLAAFALGMLAVTGVEWLSGEPLSGGTGTTFGSIIDRGDGAQQPVDHRGDPATPPTSTTSTTTPSSPTSPTSTGSPTTTSTTPSPSDSTTSTTTTAPTTTTTPPPEGTGPPPN